MLRGQVPPKSAVSGDAGIVGNQFRLNNHVSPLLQGFRSRQCSQCLAGMAVQGQNPLPLPSACTNGNWPTDLERHPSGDSTLSEVDTHLEEIHAQEV